MFGHSCLAYLSLSSNCDCSLTTPSYQFLAANKPLMLEQWDFLGALGLHLSADVYLGGKFHVHFF